MESVYKVGRPALLERTTKRLPKLPTAGARLVRHGPGGMARYGSLEVFKFCCYISIPIMMTVFIAGNPRNLEAIIKNVRCFPSPSACRVRSRHACALNMPTERHAMHVMVQRAYVVYPPEGPRPPSAEELQERMNQGKQSK